MSNIISTDVPEDLAERIEAAQEEGESRSACVRRLLRAGLNAQEPDYRTLPLLALMAGFGLILLAAEPPGNSTLYVATGGIVIVLTLAYAAYQNTRGDW